MARASDLLTLIAFLLFEFVLPKRNQSWCFCTWDNSYPHTIDNPRGVFEAVKSDPSIQKIILLKAHHFTQQPQADGINVSWVNVESIAGAYLLARSRVIILGYGLNGLCSFGRHITRKHQIVQLWHGIPLKRIGKLYPGENFWDFETRKYAATICSAPQDQHYMAAAFSPTPNVWLTGLPRNDLILKPIDQLPRDYQQHLATLKNRVAGRKFILYAPTWREKSSGIYEFSDSQLTALTALLSRNNAVIGIRAHPNRRPGEDRPTTEFGKDIFFVNEFPDANVLLRLADVLISDYSSIYIDFLLTTRPVLNFTYDLDTYVNERGFLYELSDALPDTPIVSFDELLTRLEAALNHTQNGAQYAKSRALFHTHTGSSSAAVAARIKEGLRSRPARREPDHETASQAHSRTADTFRR